jgi:ABC-2 type transport system permease protein
VLAHILRFEWRALVADRTVALVTAIFSAVLVYAALTGAGWAREQAGSLDELRDASARRVAEWRRHVATAPETETASAWGPTSPSFIGTRQGGYALLPVTSLAALAVGQSDLYVNYYKVTARTRESFIAGEQVENPLELMVGHFDLAFVMLFFYPLLILAVTYDLTSGDRENGTLRMLLAQPVRLKTLVIGRLLTRATAVVLPALLIPVVALWFTGVNIGPAALGRLGLWTLGVLGYGAFWFALAVAVNALGRPPALNALALAGGWLVLVVLVPSLINVGVASSYPLPSRVEFVNATRLATDEARVKGSRLLSRFLEDHPTLQATGQTMENFDILQAARDDEVSRQLEPVVNRYNAQLARQQAAVSALSYLSPAALTQRVLFEAAGTGPSRYQHFYRQVDGFHAQWTRYFQARSFTSTRMRPVDFDEMPAFTYFEEPLAAVASRTAAPLVIPWALACGILAAAFAGYRRFEIA